MSVVPEVMLSTHLAVYRDRKPSALLRHAEKIDGSELELEIVSELKRWDASDQEVFAYFDHYQLPRYMEEGSSPSWLQSLIKTAVASKSNYVSAKGVEEGKHHKQQHTRVIESEHNLGKQTHADGVLVHLVLRKRAEREAEAQLPILTGWRQEIIEVSAGLTTKQVSLMTARRMSKDLIEQGYVRLDPLDRKSKLVFLTEKGMKAAEPVRGKWARFIDLNQPLPFAGTWSKHLEADDDVVEESDGSLAELPEAVTAAPRRKATPSEKRLLYLGRLRKDRQINGHYRLRFKANKIRYIQLLTSRDEWAGGAIWQQLPVSYDAEGLPTYLTVLAGTMGEDRVANVLPHNWRAIDTLFAAAVELEKTDTGFRVAEYADENGELQPSVGVIAQSSWNFFRPLRAQPPGRILRVQGKGKETTRRYAFAPVGEALPLSFSYSLEPLLDSMDDETNRDRILALPPGWFHMPPKRKQLVQRLLAD